MRAGEISQGLCKDVSVYVCGIQTEPCTGAIVEVSKYKEELWVTTHCQGLTHKNPSPRLVKCETTLLNKRWCWLHIGHPSCALPKHNNDKRRSWEALVLQQIILCAFMATALELYSIACWCWGHSSLILPLGRSCEIAGPWQWDYETRPWCVLFS